MVLFLCCRKRPREDTTIEMENDDTRKEMTAASSPKRIVTDLTSIWTLQEETGNQARASEQGFCFTRLLCHQLNMIA